MLDKVPSEHYEQAMFVQWFRRTYPDVLIFAIPNGGARSITTAAALKVEGVTKGIPDLFIPAWRLWVEMKRIKGGVVSPEQKNIKKYLESVLMCVIVCKGAEDAKMQIQNFLQTKKEHSD